MYNLLSEGGGMSMVTILLIYAVIIGGFWFIFMRPQRKEQKRVQAMVAAMEVGDTVLTTSGFYGVIIDLTEDDVIVEFGNNKNCRIPMQKAAISQVEKPNQDNN
ncbi:MAG: preprotein translocase subunit YajC [Suipraeoptans sp.]